MELITRAEAKAFGLKHYFTGQPCKQGHLVERLMSTCACIACKAAHGDEYRRVNAEKYAAYAAAYYRNNADKLVAKKAEYYKANIEHIAVKAAGYRKANAEKISVKAAAYSRANPHIPAAAAAKRRAKKLQATPAWADLEAIKKVYDDCAFISKATGARYHVDHIVPLQDKTVCGLHVHYNLQIIDASDNRHKSNKLLPAFETL